MFENIDKIDLRNDISLFYKFEEEIFDEQYDFTPGCSTVMAAR
jgi:hypothetical protein